MTGHGERPAGQYTWRLDGGNLVVLRVNDE